MRKNPIRVDHIVRRDREGRTKLVVTGDQGKVGGGSRSLVLLSESLTPGLPGLVLALGVLFEDGRGFRRHG